jgi:hypothetical protein
MKNWLIRTKNNHILGPVTKDKIRDLIENGSIKQDDEICSGNGYWIFVREKLLVDKYIYSDVKQNFNPISEAKAVLSQENSEPDEPIKENYTITKDQIPSDKDLEYPDFTPKNPSEDKKVAESAPKDQEKVLDFDRKSRIEKQNIDIKPPVHASDIKKNKLQAPEIPAKIAQKSFLTFNMIISLVITFLVMMSLALYYRGHLIDFFRGASLLNVMGINQVYAQTNDQLTLKKKF